MRKGPTSHLPLHRLQTDTTEIPLTEIIDRIFTVPFERLITRAPLTRFICRCMANFLAASIDALSNKKACSTVAFAARSNEPFYHYTTNDNGDDTIEIPVTEIP